MKSIYLFFVFCCIISCKKNTEIEKEFRNPFYDSAFAYRDIDPLKSLSYFYQAKNEFAKEKDSLGIGKSLTNIGLILTNVGDNYSGQEASLSAIKSFNEKDTAQYEFLSSNYNNLGITNYNLKDFDNALKYYDLAIKFAVNENLKNIYLNNKANIYREKGEIKKAIEIYDSVLNKTPQSNEIEYARIVTNLSKAKWIENNAYDPEKKFLEALQIRIDKKDFPGQVSSHRHLSEYYYHKNPQKSLLHAQEMYKIANKINNPDDKIDALGNLILLEKPEKSKNYFSVYQKISDSLEVARNNAKNKFVLIRFDTDKKEAANLKLQAENVKNQLNILIQWIIIGIGCILAIAAVYRYKKRKKILEAEKEKEIKRTEEKYVKRVHDEVSGNVYRLMKEVENTNDIKKYDFIDQLHNIYEQTRDISYQTYKEDGEMFYQRIRKLLKNYENSTTKIVTINNTPEFWSYLNNNQQNEVFLIIQELLNNMCKHSQANRIIFNFDEEKNHITISYKDNGIGNSQNIIQKNGIRNTVSRIESLKGTYKFGKENLQKGFAFAFTLPKNKK